MNPSSFLRLCLLVLLEDGIIESDHMLAFVVFEQLQGRTSDMRVTSDKMYKETKRQRTTDVLVMSAGVIEVF